MILTARGSAWPPLNAQSVEASNLPRESQKKAFRWKAGRGGSSFRVYGRYRAHVVRVYKVRYRICEGMILRGVLCWVLCSVPLCSETPSQKLQITHTERKIHRPQAFNQPPSPDSPPNRVQVLYKSTFKSAYRLLSGNPTWRFMGSYK